MHRQKVRLIKGEAPVKLVALFLGKIERHETPEWDPVGIETLGFLVEALKVVDTKTQTWGAVTKYVLKKANDKERFRLYTSILRTLSPHVSTEVAEQIVTHLVTCGEINAVLEITVNKLNRFLSQEEVALMVTYHHQKRTSSKSNVWKSLLAVAGEEETHAIEEILHEQRIIENDFIVT